jgi:hypothetical protein
MKFTGVLAVVLAMVASSTTAFVVGPSGSRSYSRLAATSSKVSTAEAITAAKEASAKFGPTSAEARVAWDIVEELSSSDNRYVDEIFCLSICCENGYYCLFLLCCGLRFFLLDFV